jgi:outer membrane immunogenic protein
MRRVFVACVGFLALAAGMRGAEAADLSRRYGPPPVAPVYAAIYNWTGFYVGINGGGGWGRSTWDGIDKFDISGGLIGATIGYNWQLGQAVLGVEGDIAWSGIQGTTNTLCPGGCETRNSWLSTVRGRAGYAIDRLLPFLTAGLAVGNIQANTPGFPGGSSSNAGWTVGGGLEFAVVSNVTIKAEYLYVDLGTFNCGFNCGLAAGGNTSFYANVLRGGLNVRF